MIHEDPSPAPAADPSTEPNGNSEKSSGTAFLESLDAMRTAAGQMFSSGAKYVAEEAARVEEAVTAAGGTFFKESVALLARSLTGIAANPESGPGVIEEVIKLAPVIGTTKMYSDAWLKYHTGKEQQNEEMIQQARRECALSIVSAGLDITTLGISAGVRAGLRLALGGITSLHVFASLSSAQQKLINPLMDKLLEVQAFASVVDSMLTFVSPPKKEAAQSTPTEKPAE